MATYTGTCGDNLTWSLNDSTGVLNISGTGAMISYTNGGAPWYSYRSIITSVVIQNGATSIGAYAFSQCTSLKSISIADSVTSIGASAFYNCNSLISVLFSEDSKLTSIYYYAFGYCQSLTSFTIPSGVTDILNYVFYHCTSLTSIVIYDNVKSIGSVAFQDCTSLTDVYYAGDEDEWNAIITSGDNSQFFNVNIHYNYSECEHMWDETIAIAPTCIDKGLKTFTCTACGESYTEEIEPLGHAYESVVTSPTCTDKGYTTYTCSRCGDTYTSDYIPALGHIDENNDGYCDRESCGVPFCDHIGNNTVLKGAYSATCTEDGYTGDKHCAQCDEIIEYGEKIPALGHSLVAVDAKAATCTEIGWNAYEHCTVCDYTTYIEIPATGHNYKPIVTPPTCTENGFTTHTCTNCGDSYITDEVPALGHNTIHIEAKNQTCSSNGNYEYWYCTACNTYFEDEECTKATTISALTIPINPDAHIWDAGVITTQPTVSQNGVKTYTCTLCGKTKTETIDKIGSISSGTCGNGVEWTFSNNGVLYITGSGKMDNYESRAEIPWTEYILDIVEVNIAYGIKNIGDRAFFGCKNLSAVSFATNSTIESIGKYSFYQCETMIAFNIPASVTNISDVAFYECSSLYAITVESSSKSYYSNNGVLYTKDGQTLVHCPGGKSSTFEIPNGVKKIGNYAFATNKKLTMVIIPTSVTNIGYAAFKSCTKLTTVTIPTSVQTIGIIAFINCTALKTITFSSGSTVMSIGHGAFSYCTSLTSVNLEVCGQLKELRYYTFRGCSSLNYRNINLPNGIKVGYQAFYGCINAT